MMPTVQQGFSFFYRFVLNKGLLSINWYTADVALAFITTSEHGKYRLMSLTSSLIVIRGNCSEPKPANLTLCFTN